MNRAVEINAIVQLLEQLYTCVERLSRFQNLEEERIELLTKMCEEKLKEE